MEDDVATNSRIFGVRILIRDPLGFNAITEVENAVTLPSTPVAQTLYFLADTKEYQAYEDDRWVRQDVVVSNDRISTLCDLYANDNSVAAKLVNDLIVHYGQQLALAYKSHSDGAEAFDTHTLSDVLSFYKEMRKTFEDAASTEAGLSTGFYARTKRQVVGGMLG